jgi:hypothetical protein
VTVGNARGLELWGLRARVWWRPAACRRHGKVRHTAALPAPLPPHPPTPLNRRRGHADRARAAGGWHQGEGAGRPPGRGAPHPLPGGQPPRLGGAVGGARCPCLLPLPACCPCCDWEELRRRVLPLPAPAAAGDACWIYCFWVLGGQGGGWKRTHPPRTRPHPPHTSPYPPTPTIAHSHRAPNLRQQGRQQVLLPPSSPSLPPPSYDYCAGGAVWAGAPLCGVLPAGL